MKKLKLSLIIIAFLFLFLPFIKTDSEEGKIVYYDEKNVEKLYKIELSDFNIVYLDKIKDKLKIREIKPVKIGNVEYNYTVKTTDMDLSQEFMNNYYEYMDEKGKAEYLLKNNNIEIKNIIVLNTYFDIEKALNNYKYKIID